MWAVLLSPLRRMWPCLAAIGAAIAALGAAYLRGRTDAGAKAAYRKSIEDRKALEERLEMEREATIIERQASGMSEAEARKEAERWAKR